MKYNKEYDCFVCEDGTVFVMGNGKGNGRSFRKLGQMYEPFRSMDQKGYPVVTIHNRPVRLHRLVALTFIPNPEGKPFVDHIDRNRENPQKSNLRWVSAAENQANSPRADRCQERYGVRSCEDRKEYHRRRMAKWREENHEKWLSQVREYRHTSEKFKEYNRRRAAEWRKEHPEKMKEYNDHYRDTHVAIKCTDGKYRYFAKDAIRSVLD